MEKNMDMDASRILEIEETKEIESSEKNQCTQDEEVLPTVPIMGHDRDKKKRSKDVNVEGKHENVEFSDMQISDDILKGLKHCRYDKPTPIQLSAIPLGKLNYDLLLQAKSGTGKTCVFTVCILQQIVIAERCIQALVVTPSREIAVQIAYVMKSIGAFKNGLKVKEFIGGTSVAQAIRRVSKCHVAIGTPGRLAHMIKDYNMDLSQVKVIALDEADKLMEGSFFDDIKVIFNALPENKQMIATSATYSEPIVKFLEHFMKSACKIQLDLNNPTLCAVDQYMVDVKKITKKSGVTHGGAESEEIHSFKFRCLREVLKRVSCTQVIIFSNWQLRAERLYDQLKDLNFDVELLSASRSQEDRLHAFKSLQEGKCKILVATDVASRGIDIEGVDLVINFDIPNDSDTYIHRVGRTGRFGTCGKALSFCYSEMDRTLMGEFQIEIHFTMWVIESSQDLTGLNDHANKVQSYRQLKGVKEAISIKSPDNPNWKVEVGMGLNMTLEDLRLSHKSLCGFRADKDTEPEDIELAITNATNLVDKLLEQTHKRRADLLRAESENTNPEPIIRAQDVFSDSDDTD